MTRKKGNKHASPIKQSAPKANMAAHPVVEAAPQEALVPLESKQSIQEKSLSEWITFFFKHWWSFCIPIAGMILSGFVSLVISNPAPFWTFLQKNLPLDILVILVTAVAPFVTLREVKTDKQKSHVKGMVKYSQRQGKKVVLASMAEQVSSAFSTIVIPIIVPVVTTTLFLSLLLMVLVRPVWCPGSICLPAQSSVATYPGGVSNQDIDAYFLNKYQTTSYELPGALQQYSLHNLPRTIPAVRSDTLQSIPYRLVIGVQNRHQTGYEMYIDGVELVVHAVPRLAAPLHVWNTSSLIYNTALYELTYAGEPAKSILSAAFLPTSGITGIHQRLDTGQTDNIDLQIDPAHNLQADLQFQVTIIYRMANEGQEHSITLPNLFEVVFSNASNWQPETF